MNAEPRRKKNASIVKDSNTNHNMVNLKAEEKESANLSVIMSKLNVI
jgi:hypothetical protein